MRLDYKLNTGNNIIRTIFSQFKYEIESIDCVGIGPLTKKDLPREIEAFIRLK